MEKGFTLAEVLITLTIVGVIVAMTIPSLVQNSQNKELETSFKVAYSILNNAVNRLKLEKGINLHDYYNQYGAWGIYECNTDNTGSLLYKDLLTVLSYSKKEPSSSSNFRGIVKEYADEQTLSNVNFYVFSQGGHMTLNNGMELIANCQLKNNSMQIDTNGIGVPPNRWGYDLFTFHIDSNNVLKPSQEWESNYSSYCSNPNTAGEPKYNGVTCSYYALTDTDYFKNLK